MATGSEMATGVALGISLVIDAVAAALSGTRTWS